MRRPLFRLWEDEVGPRGGALVLLGKGAANPQPLASLGEAAFAATFETSFVVGVFAPTRASHCV